VRPPHADHAGSPVSGASSAEAEARPPLLITVSGQDRPGIAADLFGTLAGCGAQVVDIEQITILGRLLLAVVVADATAESVAGCVAKVGERWSVSVEVAAGPTEETGEPDPVPGRSPTGPSRHLVTVLATQLLTPAIAQLFSAITACDATVERIVRLARTPVCSYELLVAGGQPDELRRAVTSAAADAGIDVAVQRAGLHRRARHLIVMDVDSTLVQGEVVDQLAARAGCAEKVAAITAAAMAGELDFEAALRQRVGLLAGLPASVLDDVRQQIVLTPGARTLVRTLRRLGYETAVVSGGFLQVIEPVAAELGIGRVAANVLEVEGGTLTGRLVGPVVDRPGKAAALRRFAAEARIPLARTVAVGDGANDVDMLATAGLGIAFNAKPVVRDVADASVNVPYLDTILYLLGVPRSEIEAEDPEEAMAEDRSAQAHASVSSGTT
jgi:phosphoserine phosphatase